MQFPELANAIGTVIDVAGHFARLQTQAQPLLNEFSASARGYFTPTEDRQVQQLLISYWNSRNALFEVVLENRHYDAAASPEERHLRFLIAFAGALVLIDAARFMREGAQDRPIVREKLNEPEPAFGIPVGVYDQVQKSLTSPAHAWHLYHALHYLKENQRSLRKVAASTRLAGQLFDLIMELRHRLELGLDVFLMARLRTRADEVTAHLRRDLLFRAMYGLQKAVSELLSEKYTHLSHKPALPHEIIEQLRPELVPGDVLITRKEFALTNYFLPGYWPHAALYLGREHDLIDLQLNEQEAVQPHVAEFRQCGPAEEGRVLEALKDGVRLRSVATPLSCDAIAVVRPRLTKDEVGGALARGFRYVGRPYDFDFDFSRSDRLVCTEVVYRTYEGCGGLGFALVRRAGRLTLSAEDLLLMALQERGFQVIGAYAPGFTPDLAMAADATEALTETLKHH